MAAGHFVDRTGAQRTTFGDLIDLYMREVTDKRPGEASRITERLRLERFVREEPELCAHAVANLTPEQFEAIATSGWRRRTRAASACHRER